MANFPTAPGAFDGVYDGGQEVTNGVYRMTIAPGGNFRAGIGGHMQLEIITYKDEDDAIRIVNDLPYGLSGYVTSASLERARKVASRMLTGKVR